MVGPAQDCALRPRLTIPYLGVGMHLLGTDHAAFGACDVGVQCVTTNAGDTRSPEGDAYEAKGSAERSWLAFPRFADVQQRNDFR